MARPNLSGLLLDQACLLGAMAWATHYTGTRRFLQPARELLEHTLSAFRLDLPDSVRPRDGSLVDRLHDPKPRGSLGERPDNLLANARFAEALLRLAPMLGLPHLRSQAAQILGAFESDWQSFGPSIADYGRAVDLLVNEPVEVTIVGSHDGEQTRPLLRAALGPYVASRVVQVLDPVEDAAFLAQTGWPAPERPEQSWAYLHQGGQSFARTRSPRELPALMARLG